MSEISDYRETFFAIVTEAHGTAQRPPAPEPVLPPGARWVTHQPKDGPMPARRRAPASGFADLFIP